LNLALGGAPRGIRFLSIDARDYLAKGLYEASIASIEIASILPWSFRDDCGARIYELGEKKKRKTS